MADSSVDLDEYAALVRKADEFHDEVAARRKGDLACRPGCDSCCQVELLLCPVEAENVRQHLDALSGALRSEISTRALQAEGPCVMLDKGGQCSVYDARPLVCRTQGLPLRYVDVAWCDLNFLNRPPKTEDVLDAERINTILAVVNRRWAQERDVDPLERVPLRTLAAGSDAERSD